MGETSFISEEKLYIFETLRSQWVERVSISCSQTEVEELLFEF